MVLHNCIQKERQVTGIEKKDSHKIFPHMTLSIYIHLLALVAVISVCAVLAIFGGEAAKTAHIICCVLLSVSYIVMFLLLNVFYWDAPIIAGGEKLVRRRGLSIQVWYWNEIAEVRCHEGLYSFPGRCSVRFYPTVTLIHESGEKLKISMDRYAWSVFYEICPNEELKSTCADFFKRVDERYFTSYYDL